MAIYVDKRLEELGGKRMHELGEAAMWRVTLVLLKHTGCRVDSRRYRTSPIYVFSNNHHSSPSPRYDRSRPLSEILMETPTGFGDDDEGDNDDNVDFGGGGNGGGARLLSSFKPTMVPPPPPPKPTQAEIDRDVQESYTFALLTL